MARNQPDSIRRRFRLAGACMFHPKGLARPTDIFGKQSMRIREALLAGPLGFGTAPLGNMFRNISEEQANATVEAAWNAGTRFFATAPFYGAGLAEIRLGKILSRHPRRDYILS